MRSGGRIKDNREIGLLIFIYQKVSPIKIVNVGNHYRVFLLYQWLKKGVE